MPLVEGVWTSSFSIRDAAQEFFGAKSGFLGRSVPVLRAPSQRDGAFDELSEIFLEICFLELQLSKSKITTFFAFLQHTISMESSSQEIGSWSENFKKYLKYTQKHL